MDILKSVNCISCLIKCSKCLYFIKKLLCIATVTVVLISGICCLTQKDKKIKKILCILKEAM